MIRVPTEVIKTRTQTTSYGAAHASSFAAAKLVLQNQGISGFYRGFGITVMREESSFPYDSSTILLNFAVSRFHLLLYNSLSMNSSN